MLCIFLKSQSHCSGASDGTFWPTLVTLLKDRLFRNSTLRSHPFDALNEAHGIGYSLGNKTKAFLCIIFPLTDLPNFLSSRINSMIASSNSGYCAFPPRMLRRLEIFIALFLTESTIKYLCDNQRRIIFLSILKSLLVCDMFPPFSSSFFRT